MKAIASNYFRLLACLVILLFAQSGRAQLPSYYHFRNFNLKSNFPARQVNCVAEDSIGLIWIGTHSGLFRFDGNSFHAYKHDPETAGSLGSDYVSALHCDSRGFLWIGTSNSLSVYIPLDDSFFHLNLKSICPEANSSNWVTKITSDTRNHIWVSFQSGILLRIIPERIKFNTSSYETYLIEGGIRDFAFVNDSAIAIIGSTNLNLFDISSKKLRSIKIINKEINKGPFLLLKVLPDPEEDSIFWIGTWGKGLIKVDLNEGSTDQINYESGLPANISNIVFDLIPAEGKDLLIAGRVLYRFNKAERVFHAIHRDDEISDRKTSAEIRCVFRDSGKRI
ncbi:MAG: hypothetical protein KDC13_10140, partial [Bacteroidetes bacterium]|nr:hypothetical protein [Bacteroidota bacterium]